jgi:hypothetical protein
LAHKHQIESTKANEHGGGKQFPRPSIVHFAGRSPQNDEAEGSEDIGAHMENTVPENVDFQIAHRIARVAGAGQHVVPLQYLVQIDAIKEAAQTQAEKDTNRDRESLESLRISHAASYLVLFLPCI